WALAPMGASLLLVIVFGVTLTFMGGWSNHVWPWLALMLLIAMSAWMTWQGRTFYSPVRKALGLPYMTGFGTQNPPVQPAGVDEVHQLIMKSNPRLLAWVGVVFTGIVLWLMIFKPF
ncbi:MAG TPA: hypothetical protein VF784_05820, partial [Anaerolineales bacterium]